MKKPTEYFSPGEIILWGASCASIIIFFLIFDRANYLNLISSLIGVTSLIFIAKGHPFGQVLMILFSSLYAITSWRFRYYGEMITYLGMTLPLSVFSLVSWLKNPFDKSKGSEVEVNTISKKEWIFLGALAAAVTAVFYFILDFFDTANIIPSTLSITTSFIAAYLTFRRTPYFPLAYAFNDVILITLWVLASLTDISYLGVVLCFVTFLVNDSYAFISWIRMKKRQAEFVAMNLE